MAIARRMRSSGLSFRAPTATPTAVAKPMGLIAREIGTMNPRQNRRSTLDASDRLRAGPSFSPASVGFHSVSLISDSSDLRVCPKGSASPCRRACSKRWITSSHGSTISMKLSRPVSSDADAAPRSRRSDMSTWTNMRRVAPPKCPSPPSDVAIAMAAAFVLSLVARILPKCIGPRLVTQAPPFGASTIETAGRHALLPLWTRCSSRCALLLRHLRRRFRPTIRLPRALLGGLDCFDRAS